jgi:hypothetical protein
MTVFVTKPADWEVPLDEQNFPQFFYHHLPEGLAAAPLRRAAADRPAAAADQLPDGESRTTAGRQHQLRRHR